MESKKDKFAGYQVWGVGITEVEVDILTGEMFIVRSDVLEDAGLSTSPQVSYLLMISFKSDFLG